VLAAAVASDRARARDSVPERLPAGGATALPRGLLIRREKDIMDATILFVAITTLILLVVTSPRFGAESRDGVVSPQR